MGPPVHRPSSQSPIGDALKRSYQQYQRDLGHDGDARDALTRMMDDTADLTDMADGFDELTDMADGQDDLATMASGEDELAQMAAGASGTTLAEEVEAELRDVVITTRHGQPVIKEASGSIPLNADPEVVEAAAAVILERPADPRRRVQAAEPPVSAPEQPVDPPVRPQRATSERTGQARPIAWVNNESGAPSRPVPVPSAPPVTTIKPKDLVLWIPFGIMICVVLGIGGRSNGLVGFLLFVAVVAVFFALLKSTRATSRKTTSMPKQQPDNRRR